MNWIKKYLLLSLFAGSVCLSACQSDTYADPTDPADRQMYLRVNVPRTYASGQNADKETRIETIDVLVFAPGADGKYFVRAASPGTLLPGNNNRFQVIMPFGNDLIVHVFANCHDQLESRGFYNCVGKEMTAMLALLPVDIDLNANATAALPMHGYLTGVKINDKYEDVTLNVPVMRSVAAVEVMTNATTNTDGTLTPGTLTNFKLRELYVYFQPKAGRVAADATNYAALQPGAADVVREVTAPSLPEGDSPVHPIGNPLSLKSDAAVTTIRTLYLYENQPWSLKGDDYVDAGRPAATTRLVVGGVYNNETNPGTNTPRVSYYRVDFADATDASKLASVLRNHKYTFNITRVGGSGYDTPDQAALGKPINIELELIKWSSEINNADFDRENYFYAQTKSLLFPRTAGHVRTINVESDVPVKEWVISYAGTSNGRYKAVPSTDGKRLTITVQKAYNTLAAGESRAETLLIKVKNLTVHIALNQADTAPDDWGTGGSTNVPLG